MRVWFQEEIEEEEEEEDETEEDAVERMKMEISENYENDVNFVSAAVVSLSSILIFSPATFVCYGRPYDSKARPFVIMFYCVFFFIS